MSASDLPEPGMTSFDYGQRIQWFTGDQLRAYGDKRAREAVSEGWKLVPVEPTAEMVRAAQGDLHISKNLRPLWENGVRKNYADMLAAAPTPGEKT